MGLDNPPYPQGSGMMISQLSMGAVKWIDMSLRWEER